MFEYVTAGRAYLFTAESNVCPIAAAVCKPRDDDSHRGRWCGMTTAVHDEGVDRRDLAGTPRTRGAPEPADRTRYARPFALPFRISSFPSRLHSLPSRLPSPPSRLPSPPSRLRSLPSRLPSPPSRLPLLPTLLRSPPDRHVLARSRLGRIGRRGSTGTPAQPEHAHQRLHPRTHCAPRTRRWNAGSHACIPVAEQSKTSSIRERPENTKVCVIGRPHTRSLFLRSLCPFAPLSLADRTRWHHRRTGAGGCSWPANR